MLFRSVELLDTPGILWPKFEDQKVGLHLALVGSIRDDILNTDELAMEIIKLLLHEYPGSLAGRYGIEEDKDAAQALCAIAQARNCLSRGSELDYSKAAAIVVDEFRSGKTGRFTIEDPR